MDQSLHNPEVYDFRRYDRIWQRVAPTLEPYPSRTQEPETPAVSVNEMQVSSEQTVRQEEQLPGAVENPCCMGSEAAEMLEVLRGFVEETLEDRRQFLALARQAPGWAKQRLRDMAADESRHARRLMAVHYLITGECYRPNIVCQTIQSAAWCPALRDRYHAEACNGLNYARAAEGTTDPCLRQLLEELSADEYRHATQLLMLLERSLGR